jgi:hypothetical protein
VKVYNLTVTKSRTCIGCGTPLRATEQRACAKCSRWHRVAMHVAAAVAILRPEARP